MTRRLPSPINITRGLLAASAAMLTTTIAILVVGQASGIPAPLPSAIPGASATAIAASDGEAGGSSGPSARPRPSVDPQLPTAPSTALARPAVASPTPRARSRNRHTTSVSQHQRAAPAVGATGSHCPDEHEDEDS